MTAIDKICRIATTVFALGIVCGCSGSGPASGDQTAGGEDFPNTLNALGRSLAAGLDSSSSWNSLGSASTSPGVGALPDSQNFVAARAQALCVGDTTSNLLSDGFTVIRKASCPQGGGRLVDSLVIRASDSLIRILVHDSSGPLGLVRRIDTYQADTGLGFHTKGWAGRIRIGTIGMRGRWAAVSELVLDAGDDHDWDTPRDNSLWRGGSATIRGGTDTLDSWTVRSWPSANSRIYERSSGDSGLALLERRQILSSGAIRRESGVLMAFRADSLNYPRRFRARVERASDSWDEESVMGKQADSTFLPGDTARYLHLRRLGSDSLREEIRVLTSPQPRDRSGDRLLSFSSTRWRSRNAEVEVRLLATASTPMRPGADFTDGAISLRVVRATGDTIGFEGVMSKGVATGRWKTPKDSGTVAIGADGKVLSSNP